MKFAIWKLRVCFYCLWYLHHWPWNDINWREEYRLCSDPWETFLDGWCCDNDPADTEPE